MVAHNNTSDSMLRCQDSILTALYAFEYYGHVGDRLEPFYIVPIQGWVDEC
jgi:hypothetical protein